MTVSVSGVAGPRKWGGHVCQGTSKGCREEEVLGLSLQKYVGICEGEGTPGRGNSMSQSVVV